jgi:hypothetical protein
VAGTSDAPADADMISDEGLTEPFANAGGTTPEEIERGAAELEIAPPEAATVVDVDEWHIASTWLQYRSITAQLDPMAATVDGHLSGNSHRGRWERIVSGLIKAVLGDDAPYPELPAVVPRGQSDRSLAEAFGRDDGVDIHRHPRR